MTNLFTTIQTLVPRCHGWCTEGRATALAAAVLTLRPNVTVEIGVWGGRSFLPMALAHKEIGKGIVIGIDPWSPSESAAGQDGKNAEWWGSVDHDLVRQDFFAKIHEFGLGNVIQINRQTSDEFAAHWLADITIDLLSLDGNHGEQAYKDACNFGPHIRIGGLAFLDDLAWEQGFVRKAEEYLLSHGFIRLYTMDTGAMYQRIT